MDVEQCATTDSAYANEHQFSVSAPDNVRYQPQPPWREPGWRTAGNLFAGDCVRGWVTFQVPAGQRPAYIEWKSGDLGGGGGPLRWRL
jgi:hypothetical protein